MNNENMKNQPDLEHQFSSTIGHDEFYFRTLEEALKCAKKDVADKLDERWGEEVDHVKVCKVLFTVKEVDKVYRPDDSDLDENEEDEDGNHWPEGQDYICNFEMQSIKPDPEVVAKLKTFVKSCDTVSNGFGEVSILRSCTLRLTVNEVQELLKELDALTLRNK